MPIPDSVREGTTVSQNVLDITAGTTTQNSGNYKAKNYRGVQVVLNVTSIGTGSLTVRIKGRDTGGGSNTYDIAVGATITSNSVTFVELYPGSSGTPPTNSTRVAGCLPETFLLQVQHNNANPVDYKLSMHLLI